MVRFARIPEIVLLERNLLINIEPINKAGVIKEMFIFFSLLHGRPSSFYLVDLVMNIKAAPIKTAS